jgi:hypothetical protein
MQCRLLLDVVVRERSAILELLAGENKALLVRRDAFLVCIGSWSEPSSSKVRHAAKRTLDFGFYIVDGVG